MRRIGQRPQANRSGAVLAAAALAIIAAAAPLAAETFELPVPPPGAMRLGAGPALGDVLIADGPGMMLPLMLRHADLTAEQHQRVRAIMEAERDRLHKLFRELDAANDELAGKVVAPGPIDAAALKPEIDRIGQLRQELMQLGLKTALAVRAVLSPAQLERAARTQARLRELQEEMHELLDGAGPLPNPPP